jgi:hypothetical protein
MTFRERNLLGTNSFRSRPGVQIIREQTEPMVGQILSTAATDAEDKDHRNSVTALLQEVEAAVAMMELATLSSREEIRRCNYENAAQSYERAFSLLPTAVMAVSGEQEVAVRKALTAVRDWLESAGRLSGEV